MIDRAACRRADAVIAVTGEVERSLVGRAAQVVLIPPFLPDEWIEPGPPSRSMDCLMIANGMDSPRKGVDLAVEAVRHARARVRGIRLVLVGAWHDPARMQRLPDFCDARGRLPRRDVRELLRGAGCCIVPSRWEEFGYVGLEALAAGTPVVCGPLPGLTGRGTTGVLVAPVREAAVFAERLLAALALDGFEYPLEARASWAVPRILEVYCGQR
jgi:glycosyltransferase involved in cell wall biosynthesis